MRLREEVKADKERNIERQIQNAEKKTEELLNSFEKYNEMVSVQINSTDVFSVESLKKRYVYDEFIYSEKEPNKINPIIEFETPLKVPRENWLEKIFVNRKNKRLSVIEYNKNHIDEINKINKNNVLLAEKENNKNMSDYRVKKEMARNEWEKDQTQKREIIDNHNEEIDAWYNAYLSGTEDAIISYFDIVFSKSNYAHDIVIEQKIGYNSHSKKLVIDLYIVDKEVIFEAEGYKYIKQRDEFAPIKMKISAITERMRNLMIELCIATIHLLFRNDKANNLDIITVNVFHNHICCISSEVGREVFFKHNFRTKSGKAAFLELQMRIFKQFNRGVEAFDTLMLTLE